MKKIIIGAIVLGVFASIGYAIWGNDSEEAYIKKLVTERTETEAFMARDAESPFVETDTDFDGLNFFPPNLKYKVKSRFYPNEITSYLTLATNDNKEKNYEKYGYLEFQMDSTQFKLLALRPTEGRSNSLFVPFTDETSAFETYGAGRYLEVDYTEGDEKIWVDFNKAYNPYCAYVDAYSCPLPPQENHIPVKIMAGEKTYHEE